MLAESNAWYCFFVKVAFGFNQSNASAMYSAFLARASSDRMAKLEESEHVVVADPWPSRL